MRDPNSPADGRPLRRIPADPDWAAACEDSAVREAVEAGDPRRTHAALRRARRDPSSRSRREAIDRLLARRRQFLEPMKSAPSLVTLNGVGTKLYGAVDRDDRDGTHIGTLWFVFLYLPIWPLRQYLVRPEGGRSFTFFGRVPSGPVVRAWRIVAVVLVTLGAAAAGFAAYSAGRTAGVHFVNGLEYDVRVRAGTESFDLRAGSRAFRRMDVGPLEVVVSDPDGREIEREQIRIPAYTDAVVYNVLGAAPIFAEEVVYWVTPPATVSPPAVTTYFGRRFIVRDAVSYVFETPPRQISMEGNREERWAVALAPGGWRISVEALLGGGDAAGALALAERVAWSRDAPGQVEAHRLLQELLKRAGRRAEALERYRAEAESHPDSEGFAYLLARLETGPEAVAAYERLIGDHPAYPYARYGLAWHLLHRREYARAVEQYERADEADDSMTASFALYLAVALAGLDRWEEARSALERAMEREDVLSVDFVVEAGLASRGAGREFDPNPHLARLADGDVLQLLRAWYACATGVEPGPAGAPIQDPAILGAAEVLRRLVPAPAEALDLAARASEEAMAYVPREARLLLACHAARESRADVAARLLSGLTGEPDVDAALLAKVTGGTADPLLEDIDPLWDGFLALHDALSRGASLDDEAVERDLLAYDPLGGLLSRVIREGGGR